MLLQQVVLGQQRVLEEERPVAVVALRRARPLVDHLGRERHLRLHVGHRRQDLAHGAARRTLAAKERTGVGVRVLRASSAVLVGLAAGLETRVAGQGVLQGEEWESLAICHLRVVAKCGCVLTRHLSRPINLWCFTNL